jgi:hypothetical protein
MSYSTLKNYYQTVFAFKQHHGYAIQEIEELPVFERDIYLDMINEYVAQREAELGKA